MSCYFLSYEYRCCCLIWLHKEHIKWKKNITSPMGLPIDLINNNLLHTCVDDVDGLGNNTNGFIDGHKSIREF
jgi:hypothetical protein